MANKLYAVENGKLTVNFHPGQTRAWESEKPIIAVMAGRQSGKALPLNTPIATPNGFVNIANLSIDDYVYDESGNACRVTGVSAIHQSPVAYRVIFDDGCEIKTCADHQWRVQTKQQRINAGACVKRENGGTTPRENGRKPFYSVLTTEEMIGHLKIGGKWNNYSIDMIEPVQYPERELPIDPYFLGVWLGDGSSRDPLITSADPEIIEECKRRGVEFSLNYKLTDRVGNKALKYYALYHDDRRGVAATLRAMNLLMNKHIPEEYMLASVQQRIDLVHGIMDTDGSCSSQGQIIFSQKNVTVANQVAELLRSLGIKTTQSVGRSVFKGKDNGEINFVKCNTPFPLFKLERKLKNQNRKYDARINRRFVKNIVPCDTEPMRCISVDSPNSVYLCSNNYIPTHNTSFAPFWLYREIQRTAKSEQNNSYLAVSASNDLFHVAFLPAMIEVFCDVLNIGYYWSSRRTMELKCLDPNNPHFGEFYQGPTGSSSGTMWARVILRSAQSEGSLESVTALAAVLDEAGQDAFTTQDWEAVQGRVAISRSQGFGRILITTTPYSISSFLYDLYIQWTNGDTGIDFIQFPSYYNPNFSREEYERQKASMPEWRAAMFLDGKFQRPAGLIYRDFDEATMLEDDFAPPLAWERVVGVDFGGANVAIAFAVYNPYSGYWTIYDELLMGHMSAADYVNAIRAKLAGCKKYTVIGGAKSEDQFRRDWQIAGQGLYVEEPLVFEVEPGIERVIGMFKRDKLHVCRGCSGLRNELRSYRRKLDDHNNPTEQIVNKNMFHFLDSVRYAASYITDEPPAVKSMSYAEYMRKHHHG